MGCSRSHSQSSPVVWSGTHTGLPWKQVSGLGVERVPDSSGSNWRYDSRTWDGEGVGHMGLLGLHSTCRVLKLDPGIVRRSDVGGNSSECSLQTSGSLPGDTMELTAMAQWWSHMGYGW